MGVGIGFCQQDCPFTIKVESCGILWNFMESCPVTIEVVFLSESVLYNNKVSKSDDEVEFL